MASSSPSFLFRRGLLLAALLVCPGLVQGDGYDEAGIGVGAFLGFPVGGDIEDADPGYGVTVDWLRYDETVAYALSFFHFSDSVSGQKGIASAEADVDLYFLTFGVKQKRNFGNRFSGYFTGGAGMVLPDGTAMVSSNPAGLPNTEAIVVLDEVDQDLGFGAFVGVGAEFRVFKALRLFAQLDLNAYIMDVSADTVNAIPELESIQAQEIREASAAAASARSAAGGGTAPSEAQVQQEQERLARRVDRKAELESLESESEVDLIHSYIFAQGIIGIKLAF